MSDKMAKNPQTQNGWILLTKKLLCRPSPPRFGIFYATAWTNDAITNSQRERFYDPYDEVWFDQLADYENAPDVFTNGYGKQEANWSKAVKITFMDCEIRVFPDEYQWLTTEAMRVFVFGVKGECSHNLVENNEASKRLLDTAVNTDLRSLYEAALLDGCNETMAYMTAMQMDVSEELTEFPPVGWYRPIPEHFLYFCDESELEEHPPLKVE